MQDEWGNSAFARQEKRRAREREKKRRQRAMASLRVPAKPIRLDSMVEVFETRSGMLAVRGGSVTMPYVPFLHGRSVGEVR